MRGIYRRGNIFWIVYKAGHRLIRESTGSSDRKLAIGALDKRRAEVFEGRWVGRARDVRTPLSEAIQEFMTVYSKPRKASSRDDQIILNRLQAFIGPNGYLQDIDRHTVEQFQLRILDRGASKARVNRYTAILKCFFNRFVDWGKLKSNPCRGIRLYPETARTHWLEKGQLDALLDSCSDRLRPIIQIAVLTGLRRGDILRLTWDRIDFNQHVIQIVQSKTGTPLVLPMSEVLEDVLRRIPQFSDSPYVFHEDGERLRRFGWARTDFQKAIKAAGLGGTRMHDLRHTAATQLRRLGCDLPVIQQLLGHRTIRTTLRYAHVHPTELRDAMGKLGEKLLPRGADHFTITSQSGNGAAAPNATAQQIRSESQPEMLRGLLQAGESEQTVKPLTPLSEES
ncbi:MAG: site-specific integrase [Acidobacteriia bacterium]|nr:site-specific integrase [Terriglobia bacterium]